MAAGKIMMMIWPHGQEKLMTSTIISTGFTTTYPWRPRQMATHPSCTSTFTGDLTAP
jgi:hypothetical protein